MKILIVNQEGGIIQYTDKPIMNVFGQVTTSQTNQQKSDSQSAMNDDVKDMHLNQNELIKKCIHVLNQENLLVHLYDYTWLMAVMKETADLPDFSSPNSFVIYLKSLGLDEVPSDSSVKKEYRKMLGDFPNWTFPGKGKTETDRRINVAKRFLNLYRHQGK
jgi:hypothetical protein